MFAAFHVAGTVLQVALILNTDNKDGIIVSCNWWVREGFFAVGSGLKERGVIVDNKRYFRKHRVERCDKGCSVSLGGFLFLRLKGCVTWN